MMSGKYKYQRKYFTTSQFADAKSQVSASHLYRLMLETSCLQLYEHYTSLEELKRSGFAYILSRVDIIFHKPIQLYREYLFSTWARSSGILKLFRNFTVEFGGDLAAEASTLWAAVDLNTRKLIKNTDVPDPVQCFDQDITADANNRIFIPEGLVKISEKKISYSDLDLYDHMNNTKYVELVCDILPLSLQTLSRLRIDFVRECKLGEIINIFYLADGNDHYVKGVKEDGSVSFNCHAVME